MMQKLVVTWKAKTLCQISTLHINTQMSVVHMSNCVLRVDLLIILPFLVHVQNAITIFLLEVGSLHNHLKNLSKSLKLRLCEWEFKFYLTYYFLWLVDIYIGGVRQYIFLHMYTSHSLPCECDDKLYIFLLLHLNNIIWVIALWSYPGNLAGNFYFCTKSVRNKYRGQRNAWIEIWTLQNNRLIWMKTLELI